MEELARHDEQQRKQLTAMQQELRAVQRTAAVVEQGIAYSIADRSKNFLRGTHDLNDAPITHTDAMMVHDKVRDATVKQLQREKERDGRPIR